MSRAALPRAWLASAVAVIAAALAVAHQGVASFGFFLVLSCIVVAPSAGNQARRFHDLLWWAPLAVALSCSVLMALIIVAGLLGLRLWSDPWALWSWLAVLVLLAAAGVWRRGRIQVASRLSLIAWLPAIALAVVQGVRMSKPMSYWSRPIWNGTDWMNHADMVLDLQRRGLLNFALPTPGSGTQPDFYPRGLHAIMAWVVSLESPPADAYQVWSNLLNVLSWFAIGIAVLCFAAASLVGVLLVLRLGVNRGLAVVAALLIVVPLVDPLFYQPIFWWGFLTTAATAVAMFAAVQALGVRSIVGLPAALAVLLVLTFLVFNLWQLMAFPLVLVDVYLLWKWWSAGRSQPWLVGPALVASTLLCLPLARYTFTPTGTSHVSMTGGFDAVPWWLLVLVLGGALGWGGLAVRSRRSREFAGAYLVMIGATVALGLTLYGVTGSTLEKVSYYPAKILWHATMLGWPAAIAVGCWLVWWLWRRPWFSTSGSVGRLVRLAAIGTPVVLLGAFIAGNLSVTWLSSLSSLGDAGGSSPQVAMIVLEDPQALGPIGQPVLVWKLHPQGWQYDAQYEDAHANQIARSLGHPMPNSAPTINHRSMYICDWLRQHPDATRITGPRHGDRDLLSAGCPESVVQSARWRVLMTPDAWWVDTPWASVGGRADPDVRDLGNLRYGPTSSGASS